MRWHKIPKTIKEHRYSVMLSERWNLPHNKNDMYSSVLCGRPGVGKSWSTLELAWLYDRGSNDIPRFSVDRVCFTAAQFSEWLSRGSQLPSGTVIVLDDAGLALYSKETLSRVAIELGKAFQSMRYKNLIILLNLPSFGMLEAHVRKLMYDYIEIVGRDYEKSQNLAKIQKLQLAPWDGEVYRHNLRYSVKKEHPLFEVPISHSKSDFFRIDKPPKDLVVAYEKRKQEYLDEWGRKSYNKLLSLEKSEIPEMKEKINLYAIVSNHIEKNIDKFLNRKNKVDVGAILEIFNGEEDMPTVGINMANIIARRLNGKRQKGYT